MTELEEEMVPKVCIEITRKHGSRFRNEEIEGSFVLIAGSYELAGPPCDD
jgi:hypothetical protein